MTRIYKPGDRLEAATVNALLKERQYGESVQYTAPQEVVLKDAYRPQNLIRVVPDFNVPSFSVFTIPYVATSFDLVDGKPEFNVANTVTSGMVATNGSVPITSGQPGFATVMREGDFHWVRGPSSAKGQLGLGLLATDNLQIDLQGFISVGSRVVNGVTLCYVARVINTPILGITSSIIPITGTGTVVVKQHIAGTWGSGTFTLKAYTELGPIAADKPVELTPVDWRWYAKELCA